MAIPVSTIIRWASNLSLEQHSNGMEANEKERRETSRIPSDYYAASIQDLDIGLRQRTLSAIEAMGQRKRKGIVYHGNVGRGKTYCACAVLNSFLPFGRCLFLDMNSLQYASSFDCEDLMSRAKGTGLLVLDDLGKAKPGSWLITNLFNLIDYRATRGRPTIITTNHSDDLFSYLSREGETETAKGIMSRLREFEQIRVDGLDRRANRNQASCNEPNT